ncbi:MAG: DUF6512 family protein [Clostridiaceae bacterium]|nr:DUF6512 family protein [Clostridiaceae bacterium]
MNSPIFKWDLWGFIFTAVFGTCMHFFYAMSKGSPLVGIFCPVNESVWEHLKMLYFPCVAFSIAEYLYIGKFYSGFLTARACGLFIALLMTVIFYYTYTGIIGRGFVAIDILLFLFTSFMCFAVSHIITVAFPAPTICENAVWLTLILAIGTSMVLFTFDPPKINLFIDPSSGTYGAVANKYKQ